MHRIVAFAALPPHGDASPSALARRLPPVLAAWSPPRVEPEPADTQGRPAAASRVGPMDDLALSWTPPHERALAQALGMDVGDGRVPLGGLLAAGAGLPRDGRVWARVSPSHWHLGTEQVTMRDPADLALDDGDARALFESARTWFEADGFALHWVAPTVWLMAHPCLEGLRCASLDRVSGRNVDLWLGADPSARPLRRLQSEVQMLWHAHRVNQDREGRGLEPVNSFWVDGCGPVPAAEVLARQAQVVRDDRLRGPALRGDVQAWTDTLRLIVNDVESEAHQSAVRSEPYCVTWCGERSAITLTPPPASSSPGQWWRALWRPRRSPRWPDCLEGL
jgi:hypothetical protein